MWLARSVQIKRLIGSDKDTLSVLERFVAGSLAGVIAQSTIYPMEASLRSAPPAAAGSGFACERLTISAPPRPSSGAENSPCAENDRTVCRHFRLRQADLQERRPGRFLQGLRPQHVGNHPLRWHRPGCVRGEQRARVFEQRSLTDWNEC